MVVCKKMLISLIDNVRCIHYGLQRKILLLVYLVCVVIAPSRKTFQVKSFKLKTLSPRIQAFDLQLLRRMQFHHLSATQKKHLPLTSYLVRIVNQMLVKLLIYTRNRSRMFRSLNRIWLGVNGPILIDIPVENYRSLQVKE